MLVPIVGRIGGPLPKVFLFVHYTLLEIIGIIPQEELFKINLDMPSPFWSDLGSGF